MKTIETYKAQFEHFIKKQCERLTPRQRRNTILILCASFFLLFLSMFTLSIYNIGVHDGQTNIEHMERPAIINNNTLRHGNK